ncbi:MAG: O-antigen ligase [Hyphomicrobiales bacterium]|jgi:O-antigen ligase|nr:O-antigen ligase [Hyphomicrobiales bacterium]
MADTTAATLFAFDRVRLARLADWLAVGVAAAMPWSISLSQILTVAWLVALIPTLDVASVRRELRNPAGGLPVLLWLLALAGLFWADVPWGERFAGLEGFHKLLVIPLLFAQLRRSERGIYVVYGFFASCTALLLASWGLMVLWKLWWVYVPGKIPGMLVKDYIAQSTEFLICALALLGVAADRWRAQRRLAVAAILLACLFLANIFYIAPGRTAIAIMPLLLIVFGFRYFGWKGLVAACVAGAVLAAAAWAASPFLRARMIASIDEVRAYQADNTASSSGIRLEIWKKSLDFVAAAPLLGHGTGSIPEQFRRAAVGEGASAMGATHPHNQIFAVAIQLGFLGAAMLTTMWVAHLALFRGPGLIAWIGIVLVTQNLASAPFNSHLFDSFHGWLYVFGVGAVGGIVLRARSKTEPP